MGIHKVWSISDTFYLLTFYKERSISQLAFDIGCSDSTITNNLKELNLSKTNDTENINPREIVKPIIEKIMKPKKELKAKQKQYKKAKRARTAYTAKTGIRDDINFFVRSTWEANFIRFLKHKNIEFQYEPKMFTFDNIRYGTVSYIPDFYLPKEDIWIEIKGWLQPKSKCKMRRFKKYFPDDFKKLKFICLKEDNLVDKFFKEIGCEPYCYYNELVSQYGKVIENWEN